MMQKKLRQYYLYGLLPALVVTLILTMMNDFMAGCFFMVGFIWPYSNYTPNLREKLSEKPGKLSFLNLSVQIHDFLFKTLGQRIPHFILRAIVPAAFAGVIMLVTGELKVLLIFAGVVFFESFSYLSKKKNLDFF